MGDMPLSIFLHTPKGTSLHLRSKAFQPRTLKVNAKFCAIGRLTIVSRPDTRRPHKDLGLGQGPAEAEADRYHKPRWMRSQLRFYFHQQSH